MTTISQELDFEEKIRSFQNNSNILISDLRQYAYEMFGDNKKFVIGVNGSLARREYTRGSDIDLFFVAMDENLRFSQDAQAAYRAKLGENSIRMPATGGVFEKPISASLMISNIGGDGDTNTCITRRMLFLLEGDWVFNDGDFYRIRCGLIERYVEDDLEDKKICLFLLNDIVRYWRTICVDYEYKIAGGAKAKAIRLIKLRFSRMLLYFAGVIAIGKTKDMPYTLKRATLKELLATPPIERLRAVIGERSLIPMQLYADFLCAIDDPSIRARLEEVGESGILNAHFEHLSAKAREFRDSLIEILLTELGTAHPVIKALLL